MSDEHDECPICGGWWLTGHLPPCTSAPDEPRRESGPWMWSGCTGNPPDARPCGFGWMWVVNDENNHWHRTRIDRPRCTAQDAQRAEGAE
jgi:hypothetical protein